MIDTKHARRFVLAALAAGAVFTAAPRAAQAEEVSPSGKGIVGGALLGGEIVVFTEAIIGVRSTTAYLVGAGGGAVAGGVGGYFVEQAVSDGRIPAYLLAGGLALLIPAIVVTLDQTRYLPTEGAREDKPVNNLPPSDPGKPGGSAVIGAEAPAATPPATPANPSTPATTPGGTTPAPAPVPGGGSGGKPAPVRAPQTSLINLQGTGLRVGVPVPEVRPVFTAQQKKALGVENSGNEVRFPVVNVTF
jgi:hypothetical protein